MKKQISNLLNFLIILSLSFFFSSALSAEEKKEKPTPELPKSGSLSSTVSGVYDSRVVPGPWGGVDPSGESSSPISGSVSRVSANKWVMKVFNNSDDTYSVNLAVHQFNLTGSKIKSDSFSYNLKPGESAQRDITSLAQTEQCSLDLVSWRKIGS